MPRLFIAIDLPPVLRRLLTNSLPEIPGVRWVTTDNLHLTLRFAGEVAAPRIASLSERLGRIEVPSFAIETGEVVFFPNVRNPGVLAIRMTTGPVDYQLLTQLHSDVSTILEEEIALAEERRPFLPHVTLARMKKPVPVDVRRAASAAESLVHGGPHRFRVDTFVLYESVLRPGGPVYHPLRIFPLRNTGSDFTR